MAKNKTNNYLRLRSYIGLALDLVLLATALYILFPTLVTFPLVVPGSILFTLTPLLQLPLSHLIASIVVSLASFNIITHIIHQLFASANIEYHPIFSLPFHKSSIIFLIGHSAIVSALFFTVSPVAAAVITVLLYTFYTHYARIAWREEWSARPNFFIHPKLQKLWIPIINPKCTLGNYKDKTLLDDNHFTTLQSELNFWVSSDINSQDCFGNSLWDNIFHFSESYHTGINDHAKLIKLIETLPEAGVDLEKTVHLCLRYAADETCVKLLKHLHKKDKNDRGKMWSFIYHGRSILDSAILFGKYKSARTLASFQLQPLDATKATGRHLNRLIKKYGRNNRAKLLENIRECSDILNLLNVNYLPLEPVKLRLEQELHKKKLSNDNGSTPAGQLTI